METIVSINGKVKYKLTLDPGVWIFDDRKVDLHTYFKQEEKGNNDMEEYTKSISKHWDREIMEGAVFPPTLKSERKYEKERVLHGTFGIPFKPFLENAEPEEGASTVIIHHGSEHTEMPLDRAYGLILGFSKDGKPLIEDGPLYAYFPDGSNFEHPIRNISGFTVE
ncbi:peptidyl-prolyl cis-trans isomerase [Bacillus sp. REN3]|uniref:peptidyl-prolyl cis-trans isomerase n=1 Tax=Bacillus sp. REN3 TaxID=2802440 RepID=UPI001AEEA31A|nr:peptidyl-prolyl cis-trans isomerase [Bacillus sp. REN3]